MHDGITKAWTPPLETTPIIRAHRINLEVIWIGEATYTIAEAEKMISEMQLAVAEQKQRIRNLELQQLTEASATPL